MKVPHSYINAISKNNVNHYSVIQRLGSKSVKTNNIELFVSLLFYTPNFVLPNLLLHYMQCKSAQRREAIYRCVIASFFTSRQLMSLGTVRCWISTSPFNLSLIHVSRRWFFPMLYRSSKVSYVTYWMFHVLLQQLWNATLFSSTAMIRTMLYSCCTGHVRIKSRTSLQRIHQ